MTKSGNYMLRGAKRSETEVVAPKEDVGTFRISVLNVTYLISAGSYGCQTGS